MNKLLGSFDVVKPYATPLGLLIVTYLAMVIAAPGFGGESAVFSVLENFALLGLVALGVGVTMLTRELDLSVGSVAACSAVIAMMLSSWGLWPAILIAVLAGTAFGMAQGWVIARFGVNSLMLTIGSLIMIRGLTFVISSNETVVLNDMNLAMPFVSQYGVFSLSSIIAIAAFLAVGLLLAVTRPGRHLYAVGGAREEARAAGVSVTRSLVLAFALSGACASLAGALAAFRGGSAVPTNYADVLLPAVAAALLGGVALSGGKGTVINIVLGVAILGTISAGLAYKGVDASINQLVQGGLLITVLTVEFVGSRVWRRRHGTSAPIGASLAGAHAT